MKSSLQKLALTAHVTVSVGWLGAAAAVLALGIAGVLTHDSATAGGVYLATDVIWRGIIIPFSLAALVTGLANGIGTTWGLFRHYWVLTKLLVTVAAVLLLLLHTGSLLPALAREAAAAPDAEISSGHHGGVPPRIHLLIAASGSLLLLLGTTALSVYKPWGKTRRGRRGEA